MPTTISAREAALHTVAAVRPGPSLRIPLDDALGSVLAEEIVSPIDVPFWTNSAMDGYAARAIDVAGATAATPKRLTVVDRVPAGQFPARAIGPGQCTRLFTGSPIPEGADSVIRQEDTDLGDPVVLITNDRDAGTHLRRAGEDIGRGTRVFEAGTQLGPAQLGVLASLAVAYPVVYRRPRIAILASGDEIVDIDSPDEILAGRRIASSNTHTLMALVKTAGGIPVNLGIALDNPDSVRSKLALAADCDMVITSAGISVGEHDHLRGVIADMGGSVDFWRLRMRPGAPVGFGSVAGIPWLGLPGNPVSTMVTFELFGRPAIRRMMGQQRPFRRTIRAQLGEPVRLGPRLQHFLRVVATGGPLPQVRLTGPQGSGILTSLATATALAIIPEGQFETPAGAEVDIIRLDEVDHQIDPAF